MPLQASTDPAFQISKNPEGSRKLYTTPELISLGDLVSTTKNAGSAPKEDLFGATGSQIVN